jgi:hypothetical protein
MLPGEGSVCPVARSAFLRAPERVAPTARCRWASIHAELDAGLQLSAGYTVGAAVEDWLEHGLSGRSARTVQLYRDGVKPLTDRLGALAAAQAVRR